MGTCWAVTVQGSSNIDHRRQRRQRHHRLRLRPDRASTRAANRSSWDRGRELGHDEPDRPRPRVDSSACCPPRRRKRGTMRTHVRSASPVAVAASRRGLAGCGSDSSDSNSPTATAGTVGRAGRDRQHHQLRLVRHDGRHRLRRRQVAQRRRLQQHADRQGHVRQRRTSAAPTTRSPSTRSTTSSASSA